MFQCLCDFKFLLRLPVELKVADPVELVVRVNVDVPVKVEF
jgi:hypothetical protein